MDDRQIYDSVMIPRAEYARLVEATAHLETIMQCRFKPVEQVKAVLHAIADAKEAPNA